MGRGETTYISQVDVYHTRSALGLSGPKFRFANRRAEERSEHPNQINKESFSGLGQSVDSRG